MGGPDDGQYVMDVDGSSLSLTLGLPISQSQSGVSTQSDKTTITPMSTSLDHGNATSQSSSDHTAHAPPSPLLTGNLLDAGPVADPLASKAKSKVKTGTVLKDTGHQTARFILYNVLPCRLL